MAKSARTIVDHQGTAQRLGKFTFEIPGGNNDQQVELLIPTAWITAQTCPEHHLAHTHYRAHWAKHPLVPFSERPAVMFRCPRGHVWEALFTNPEEGSW